MTVLRQRSRFAAAWLLIGASVAALLIVFALQKRHVPIARDAKDLLDAMLANESDYIFDHSIESEIETGLTKENYRVLWQKRIAPFLSRCKAIGAAVNYANGERQGLAHQKIELPQSKQVVPFGVVAWASDRGGLDSAMSHLMSIYYFERLDAAGRRLSSAEIKLARANGLTYDLAWLKSLGVKSLIIGRDSRTVSLEDYIAGQRRSAARSSEQGTAN